MWANFSLSWEFLILLASLFFLLRYFVQRKFSVLKKLSIPHPKPSIFTLGNMTLLQKDLDKFFMADFELKKKYGKVYGLYFGFTPRIIVSDLSVMRQIFITEFRNFSIRQINFRKLQGKFMNQTVLNTSGQDWKRMRGTLTPAFSSSKLKDMIGILDQCTSLMVENLHKKVQAEGGTVDFIKVFGNLSLDAICSAAFGVSIYGDGKSEGVESKISKMARKISNNEFAKGPLILLFFMFPSTEWIGQLVNFSIFPQDTLNYFRGLVNTVIKSRQESGLGRLDLLRLMLENELPKLDPDSQKGMTREEIIANAVIFMIAGYETTSTTMLFLSYNLAFHKGTQERLRNEIKKKVEEHGDLTYEALNSMKYFDQCLNESMRLYPPNPRFARTCTKETTIDGITIPRGVQVDFPIFMMSRDKEYWNEPLKFDPDRMADLSKMDPLLFIPFGAGPRNCIGLRFALMEIKLSISRLLLNFELDPCPDTPKPPLDVIFKTSMRPKEDQLNFKITPITSETAELQNGN